MECAWARTSVEQVDEVGPKPDAQDCGGTCAKVPGAPCTTQLRVGQPNSHNGMQGATCYPPGAADQKQ